MEDIDLTMLARSAYRAILRSVETAEAEEPETVKEVVPMAAQKDWSLVWLPWRKRRSSWCWRSSGQK